MTSPAISPASALITPSSWAYFAQRAVSGAWLDRAGLPLRDVALTWDLQTDTFAATISPAYLFPLASDGRPVLDEWSTLIYAVADGVIRWGGILTHTDYNGPVATLSGVGFRGYPAGIPYLGAVYKQTGVDPLTVVRMLWAHLQSYPAGNLHLAVDSAAASQVRVGTAVQPYELDAWNNTDCGAEMGTLLAACPAEAVEAHAFTASGEAVTHTLSFGVPRACRRRDDLRFVEDENVGEVIQLTRDGAAYANGVAGTGAGTGSASITAQVAVDDGRLRRVTTYQNQAITTAALLKAAISKQLTARSQMGGAAQVTITNHPNAPIGAVGVGDDILLQFVSGWLAGQAIWHRVTAITLTPETGRMVLATARSDSFAYAPAA